MPIQSNYSRRFFDPDEFNSKSSQSLRRVKEPNKTTYTYKFDPYALPLSDKPHFEFPEKMVKSAAMPSSSMMKKAAWDVDDDGDTDEDEEDGGGEIDGEDAVAVDGESLRDRHKMLNDEIYGYGTGFDNNRRGSRSSKYLQVRLLSLHLITYVMYVNNVISLAKREKEGVMSSASRLFMHILKISHYFSFMLDFIFGLMGKGLLM